MKNLSKQELKIILLEQLLKNLNEMLKKQNPRKLVKDKIAFYVFNESKYPFVKLNGKLTIDYKNNIKQKLKQSQKNLPKEFKTLEKNNDLSKINPEGILSNTIKMFNKQSMEENFTLVNS